MTRATAQFTVDTFDGASYDAEPDGTDLSEARLAKTFHGDVEGSSTVRMLAARTPVETSMAYVALERFVGSVHGRKGSFVLLHAATNAGASWQIVTDSGTGELTGLVGTAEIVQHPDGSHDLVLDYDLK